MCVGGSLWSPVLGFQRPPRPQAGPCWLRLSSSALHTHMDTTAAFPSLNCTMNGWPCGEEEQVVTGEPQALYFTTLVRACSQLGSYFSPTTLSGKEGSDEPHVTAE